MNFDQLHIGNYYKCKEEEVHKFVVDDFKSPERFEGVLLKDISLLFLGFTPVCFTVWSKKGIFLRPHPNISNLTEALFGSTTKRKLRDIQYLHELQDLWRGIYGEQLEFTKELLK